MMWQILDIWGKFTTQLPVLHIMWPERLNHISVYHMIFLIATFAVIFFHISYFIDLLIQPYKTPDNSGYNTLSCFCNGLHSKTKIIVLLFWLRDCKKFSNEIMKPNTVAFVKGRGTAVCAYTWHTPFTVERSGASVFVYILKLHTAWMDWRKRY